MRRPIFTVRHLLVIVTCAAILFSIAVGYIRMCRSTQDNCRLAVTGLILKAYIENKGKWPNSWDEIRHFLNSHPGTSLSTLAFDDLQHHIDINFEVNPSTVIESHWGSINPLPVLVSTKTGFTGGKDGDPNTMIYLFFQNKQPKDPEATFD